LALKKKRRLQYQMRFSETALADPTRRPTRKSDPPGLTCSPSVAFDTASKIRGAAREAQAPSHDRAADPAAIPLFMGVPPYVAVPMMAMALDAETTRAVNAALAGSAGLAPAPQINTDKEHTQGPTGNHDGSATASDYSDTNRRQEPSKRSQASGPAAGAGSTSVVSETQADMALHESLLGCPVALYARIFVISAVSSSSKNDSDWSVELSPSSFRDRDYTIGSPPVEGCVPASEGSRAFTAFTLPAISISLTSLANSIASSVEGPCSGLGMFPSSQQDHPCLIASAAAKKCILKALAARRSLSLGKSGLV
jgi:hypothetical protein